MKVRAVCETFVINHRLKMEIDLFGFVAVCSGVVVGFWLC